MQQDLLPSSVCDRTRELVTALFIIPIRKWKEATEDQELQNKLKAILTVETKQATAAALMEVDNEPNMSKAKMNDLIKQAVTKETAALRKELNKLKRESSPHPKESRGRRQGASEKEKKGNKQKEKKGTDTKVKFAKGSAPADDHDKGTKKSRGALRPSSYSPSPKGKRNNRNKMTNKGRKLSTKK